MSKPPSPVFGSDMDRFVAGLSLGFYLFALALCLESILAGTVHAQIAITPSNAAIASELDFWDTHPHNQARWVLGTSDDPRIDGPATDCEFGFLDGDSASGYKSATPIGGASGPSKLLILGWCQSPDGQPATQRTIVALSEENASPDQIALTWNTGGAFSMRVLDEGSEIGAATSGNFFSNGSTTWVPFGAYYRAGEVRCWLNGGTVGIDTFTTPTLTISNSTLMYEDTGTPAAHGNGNVGTLCIWVDNDCPDVDTATAMAAAFDAGGDPLALGVAGSKPPTHAYFFRGVQSGTDSGHGALNHSTVEGTPAFGGSYYVVRDRSGNGRHLIARETVNLPDYATDPRSMGTGYPGGEFTGASNHKLIYDTKNSWSSAGMPFDGSGACAILAWAGAAGTTSNVCAVSVCDETWNDTDQFRLQFNGATVGDPVRFNADGGTDRSADTTTGYSVNTLYMITGVQQSTSDRWVEIDGASRGTVTGATTPTGLDVVALGAVRDSTPDNFFGGGIWEVILLDQDPETDATLTKGEAYGTATWGKP